MTASPGWAAPAGPATGRMSAGEDRAIERDGSPWGLPSAHVFVVVLEGHVRASASC